MALYAAILSMGIMILAGGSFCAAAETGQDVVGIPQKPQKESKESKESRKQFMDPEVRLKVMSAGLNLTEEQQAKIKKILDDEYKRKNDVRKDSTLSYDQIHEITFRIAQEARDSIKSLLTPDQQGKFEFKYQQMQKRREGVSAPPRPEERNKQ